MATLIEDYALIGDMQTAALVARDGSVDWLCLPRFDSPAVFAGLLGGDEHGCWRLAPAAVGAGAASAAARRRYRGDSLVLESEWDTPEGTVRVLDLMPPRQDAAPVLVRIVEGVRGRVTMRSALRPRFSYGRVVPWVRRVDPDGTGTPGYDADRNTFTRSYGSRELDASLLLIPQVGFLPPGDPRVAGTVEAVRRELCEDGFVRRYPLADGPDRGGGASGDGLPGGEGVFLACSFWLAHDLALIGRRAEGRRLFERLLELRNDVGLLAEEWDTRRGRLVGNFPQAFSHVPLIDAALRLGGDGA